MPEYKYKTLLFDADGTLLDFERSEREAIANTMPLYGIAPTYENITLYSKINDSLWKKLERGEIKKSVLLYHRFELLFEELHTAGDAKAMCEDYMKIISAKGYVLDGAWQMCERLSKNFKMYIVTNGAERVQRGRYAVCKIDRFFENVFISDVIGHQKPSVEFFECVASSIDGFDKSRTLIVGDSLTSDIKGGVNFGIDTCWYNPECRPLTGSLVPTYTAGSFAEVEKFILGEVEK